MDAKGRIAIPAEIRTQLGLEAGDAFFFDTETGGVIRIAKVHNPFDALADDARDERRLGKTRRLRDYAAEYGIDPDVE